MNDLNPNKLAKVLFFVNGPVPSPTEYAEAQALKATVVFRNAQAVPSDPHALEMCDGVAGSVPPQYEISFDSAKVAISKKDKYFKDLASKVGDEAIPQIPKENKEAANSEADAEIAGEGGIDAEKPVTPTGKPKAKAWNPG